MSACLPRGAPRVKRARGRLCPTGSEPLLAQGGWRGPWCAAGSLAALGDSRMVAGSRGLEGLTSGELLLGPGAGRSRALAQKRGRLLTARPPGPGCLGTGARRPRVPCGQRAVGVRQWWRLGGRRGRLGARLESRLVFILGGPCCERWPPDHAPRAECEGRPAQCGVAQEAGTARATAELGRWRGLPVT